MSATPTHHQQIAEGNAHTQAAGKDNAVLEVVHRSVRIHRAFHGGQQCNDLEQETQATKHECTHRSQQAGHITKASIHSMSIAPNHRELELQSALQQELTRVDPTVLPALARALERSNDRLVGGSWGVDDGDGCLLTLAAHELGLGSGEELLGGSIAAVRIPPLFDELWICILERTGDATAARVIVHRLVIQALLQQTDQADGSGETSSIDPPESARNARVR